MGIKNYSQITQLIIVFGILISLLMISFGFQQWILILVFWLLFYIFYHLTDGNVVKDQNTDQNEDGNV